MSDAATRLNAALEGRYTIERELGEGGMATVYLARDLRHNRSVALKVLKPELAAVVGAERFLAEIETTANLQHPHILPLFDSGEADGFLFYVMPYVEGESLRERLDREAQLPVEEAVQVATEVAEALQAAHEAGFVHRDIKPANILLAKGGALVADFGIARATAPSEDGRLTETGARVGTPRYMSPEQAAGEANVGPAADTYALGCVMYEMLVGEPPYTGRTPQAILGKIVASDPEPMTSRRKSVPANVEAAVRVALEKLPADRFTSTAAFGAALLDPTFTAPTDVGTTTDLAHLKPFFAAAAVTVVAVVGTLWFTSRPPTQLSLRQYDVSLPAGHQLVISGGRTFPFDVSNDETRLAYVAEIDGVSRLLVRDMADGTVELVEGTAGARHPFFSPDGTSLGFFAENELRWVDVVTGGAPVTIARAPGQSFGASWGEDGSILYSLLGSGLYLVNVESVEDPVHIEIQSVVGDGELGGDSAAANVSLGTPRWPELLPGGEHALVTLDEGAGVLDLRSGEVRGLTAGGDALLDGSQTRVLRTGQLVFHDGEGRVRAVGFDTRRRQVTSAPIPAIDGHVLRGPGGGAGNFRVSERGTLFYAPGDFERTLELVDPRTNETRAFEELRGYRFPRFSPDGTKIAITVDPRPSNVVLIDRARGSADPLTTEAHNMINSWAPDGRRIASWRDAVPHVLDIESRGPPAPFGSPPFTGSVGAWPESDRLVLVQQPTPGNQDLTLLDLTDESVTPLVATPRTDRNPSVPRTLEWVTYDSNVSGSFEVYARPYPEGGPEIRVSDGGGVEPIWSADGRQLFYRRADTLKVVDVAPEPPYFGTPGVLLLASQYDFTENKNWDVAQDGVIAFVRADPAKARRFVVVVGFADELARRIR